MIIENNSFCSLPLAPPNVITPWIQISVSSLSTEPPRQNLNYNMWHKLIAFVWRGALVQGRNGIVNMKITQHRLKHNIYWIIIVANDRAAHTGTVDTSDTWIENEKMKLKMKIQDHVSLRCRSAEHHCIFFIIKKLKSGFSGWVAWAALIIWLIRCQFLSLPLSSLCEHTSSLVHHAQFIHITWKTKLIQVSRVAVCQW